VGRDHAAKDRGAGEHDRGAGAEPSGLKALADEHPWLLTSLATVGLVAAGGAILTLFFSLGDRPAETWATDAPEVGSRDFLLGISGTVNAPLARGGSARLLKNGDEIYGAILRAIRDARQTVNFMAYVWEPGRASDMVFDALVERARAGVEVRLLLDGVGALHAPEDRIEELTRAGDRRAGGVHGRRGGGRLLAGKPAHRRVARRDGRGARRHRGQPAVGVRAGVGRHLRRGPAGPRLLSPGPRGR
jgi:hypothetical protein